jgi:hypothetical protein
MSDSYPNLIAPWTPAGAPTDAAEPDTIQMAPIGPTSVSSELSSAAKDYRNAVKHA